MTRSCRPGRFRAYSISRLYKHEGGDNQKGTGPISACLGTAVDNLSYSNCGEKVGKGWGEGRGGGLRTEFREPLTSSARYY